MVLSKINFVKVNLKIKIQNKSLFRYYFLKENIINLGYFCLDNL